MRTKVLPLTNVSTQDSVCENRSRFDLTTRQRRRHDHMTRALSPPKDSDLDRLQMDRLAKALLSKDHRDLAALTTVNPDLMDEWHQAFQQLRNETEKTARVWAAAAAVLASAKALPDTDSHAPSQRP